MAKNPLKRVYRSEKLTSEQAARDEENRRKVEMEYPPLEAASASPVLSEPLKNAIKRSRKSVQGLAEEANVSAIVVKQFMAGQRDLRLATAEKLACVLGLKLG